MIAHRREQLQDAALALLVCGLTFLTFYPALHGQFITFSDDAENLLSNPDFRGLAWANLKWMFTTAYLGPYQPLTWLSYALDFKLWGLDAFGFHLTSLLLHCANAVLFYFVAKKLLGVAMPSYQQRAGLPFAAAIAALLFSVHPLRVEPVSWLTERRTMLCGLWYLASILCYLKAVSTPSELSSRRKPESRRKLSVWAPAFAGETASMRFSWIFFSLSLLSKGISISLPMTLLVLDVYPLRRLEVDLRQWMSARNRCVLLEKTPFLIVSLAFGLAEIAGYWHQGRLAGLEDRTMAQRLALALFGAVFYLRKTLSPVQLSYSYGLPAPLEPISAWYGLYAAEAVGIFMAAWLCRKRWPAVSAATVYYLVGYLPLAGLLQFSFHIVADRYTYLFCMGWPLVAAGACLEWRLLQAPVAAAILLFSVLSWRQAELWHDSVSVWRQAVLVKPMWVMPRNLLASALAEQGRMGEAKAHLRQALRLGPDFVPAVGNYADFLMKDGRWNQAVAVLERLLDRNPKEIVVKRRLADALAGAGRWPEAARYYRELLQLDPLYDAASNDFGNILMRLGLPQAAEIRYLGALRLDPANPGLLSNLGDSLSAQKRFDEAANRYEESLRLDPNQARVLNNYGALRLYQEQWKESADLFRKALEIDPGYPEAAQNLKLAKKHIDN